MKGKTKTILTVLIAILVFAIAIVGTVTFLKDDGEASATEEGVGNVLPVTGADGEQNPTEGLNGNENPADQPTEENNSNPTEGTTGGNAQGTTGNQGTTTENRNPGSSTNAGQTEPEPTTIEQERLVSTTLNWSNISLNSTIGRTGINYTKLAYVIKYYQVIDEEKVELIKEENGMADYETTVEVTEEQIKENCPKGYILDEEKSDLSKKITENVEENVMEVYYKKDRFDLTIEYEYEDGTPATDPYEKDYEYEEEYKVPSPEIPGYTPSEEVVEGTMPAEDTTIKVIYTPNKDTKYKVEHYLENLDGTFTLKDTDTLEGTTDTTVTATPNTYEGFTFDSTVKGTVLSGTIAGDGSLVLKLYYTRNSYKVTYQYEGTVPTDATKLPETKSYKYGETVTVASNATATGYTFSGWDKEDFTMPADNVVIKGKFNINSYKVTYEYEGTVPTDATALPTEATYEYGASVTVAEDATATGYTFSGWDKEDFTMPADNVVIKGKFNINSYKVTYEYEGTVPTDATALPTEATYEYGASVTVAENATATGYTFSGWDKEDFTMPADDVVIKGSFTVNQYEYKIEYYYEKLTYTSEEDRFELDGNKTTNWTKANYGSEITVNPAETDGGYVLSKTETTESDKVLPLIISENKDNNIIRVYYIRKTEIPYEIRYYKDSTTEGNYLGSVTGTAKFGETITANTTKFIPTGYKFDGKKAPTMEIKLEGNILNVVYVKDSFEYTIEYYRDGENLPFDTETDKVLFGTEISNIDDKIAKQKSQAGEGYEHLITEGLTLTIGADSTKNIIKVYYAKPDISIEKTASKPNPNVGEKITYTITLTNKGKVAGTTTVTDTLPEGLTFVSADNGGNNDNGTVTWANVTVPAEGETKLYVTVKVNANKVDATITNTASFSEGTPTTSEKTEDSSTITVNGITATVKEGTDSVNVVLVMDLSYSMQEYKITKSDGTQVTRLEAAKTAANNFIDNLYKDGKNKNATVTVITFNTAESITETTTVGYEGITKCEDQWHYGHWNCKEIDGVLYKEWKPVKETVTVPYSGTSQLGETATSSTYSTLKTKISNITLPDTNPGAGLGTNVSAALNLTKTTIPNLNSNNRNVVILLSDGKPTTNYSGNSDKDLTDLAGEIKQLPALFYSIGFGDSALSGNSLLKSMSSNNKVYNPLNDTDLNNDFKEILGEIEPKNPTTVEGIIKVTLSYALDTTKAVTISYGGTTIYTCSNVANDEYITYDSTKKELTFNINKWNSVEANTKILTEQVTIMCHVKIG